MPGSSAPGTVRGVQGGQRDRWLRPVLAGVIALLLVLAALYALDRAGSHAHADAWAALAVALIAGAVTA